MAYDLEEFIADCRAALARDPGPQGREEVRVRLERLLANPDFVRDYCGDDAPKGVKILYEDPQLGFQVLAHINEQPRTSPPLGRPGRSVCAPSTWPERYSDTPTATPPDSYLNSWPSSRARRPN